MKISIVIILFFSIQCKAQTWNNLVPNYSVEEVTAWPTTDDGGNGDNNGQGKPMSYIEDYWEEVLHWTHPLKKPWSFNCDPKVPTADLRHFPDNTTIPSRSGMYHLNTQVVESGEYIVVPIEGCFGGTTPCLDPNKIYYLDFYAKGANVPKAWLNDNQPEACGYTYIGLDQLIFEASEVHQPSGSPFDPWHRYRTFFKPNGNNKKWLILGPQSQFDDVRIYEVGENMCRDYWYFDNMDFNYTDEFYQAGEFIEVGKGVDPESTHIHGKVTALEGSITLLRAGDYIYAPQGANFEVEPGAIFEAYPFDGPCVDLCIPELLTPQEYSCVTSPINIGLQDYNNEYVNVVWQPADYLDDPSSTYPIFTPPPGSGVITYQMHYTPNCGISDNLLFPNILYVTISYTDQPNTTPTLVLSNLSYDDFGLDAIFDVNNVVSEIEVQWSPYQSYGGSQVYTKDPFFLDGSLEFSLSHLVASCCQDVGFTVIARDVCGNEEVINFDWVKSLQGQNLTADINTLILTPGTSVDIPVQNNQGGTSYITSDPQVCFDVTGACTYEVEVINSWGQTKWEESGFVTGSPQCLFWQGTNNNGTPLSDANYWVLITVENDCGDVATELQPVLVLNNTTKTPVDTPVSIGLGKDQPFENNYNLTTSNQGIIIDLVNDFEDNTECYVYNMFGQLVSKTTLNDHAEIQLASGMYLIVLIRNGQIELREKVTVVNN